LGADHTHLEAQTLESAGLVNELVSKGL